MRKHFVEPLEQRRLLAGTQIAIEAEDFEAQSGGGGPAANHAWLAVNDSAASNGAAVIAGPNNNVNVGDSFQGPRLDYEVTFTSTDRYYVWVLLNGANGNDDSVHVGLEGVPASFGGLGVAPGPGDRGEYAWVGTGGSAQRLFVDVGSATSVRTLNLWMREDGVKVDRIILTTDPNFNPANPSAPIQEIYGRVEVEAESFTAAAGGSGQASTHNWALISDSGAHDGLALQATPNSGVNTGDGLNGPRRDYAINFARPGLYYVWAHMNGATGNDDSVHIGLSGAASTIGGGLSLTSSQRGNGWHWTNRGTTAARLSINVPTAGVHTLNLWMREDGVKVDRIVLERDPFAGPFSAHNEIGGHVEVEAESGLEAHSGVGASADHAWVLRNSVDASGGVALSAEPNVGVNVEHSPGSQGPGREYLVNITNAGTYYAWVRMSGGNGTDDSVFLTHGGTTGNFSLNSAQRDGRWVWVNGGGFSIQHTGDAFTSGRFSLSMREDGTRVDKFLLTRDADFDPNADGDGDGERLVGFEHLNVPSLGTAPYNDPAGFTFTNRPGSGDGPNGELRILGPEQGFASRVLSTAEWGRKIVITQTDGTAFSLGSFDYAGGRWGEPGDATVTGFLANGSTQSRSYSFTGRSLSTLALNWSSLTRVEINFAGGVNSAFGSLDNFRFE